MLCNLLAQLLIKIKKNGDYGKQYRQNSLEKHKIFLPIYKNGNPDWEYMENFIKQIEKENNSLLKMIRKVK